MSTASVTIDAFPDKIQKYCSDYCIVCIDIFRATTTAITALSLGREVYPVTSTDEAFKLASTLNNPLLVGEQGGHVPYGFDLSNSPVQVIALNAIPVGAYTDINRPIILLSSSGTELIKNSANAAHTYIACLRNLTAMANYLTDKHPKVAILGAGTRGEFRREDQIGCAWLAEKLVQQGFQCENETTKHLIQKWSGKDLEKARSGRSAEYLTHSAQTHDMEFILHHIDDLDLIAKYQQGKFSLMEGSYHTHPW